MKHFSVLSTDVAEGELQICIFCITLIVPHTLFISSRRKFMYSISASFCPDFAYKRRGSLLWLKWCEICDWHWRWGLHWNPHSSRASHVTLLLLLMLSKSTFQLLCCHWLLMNPGVPPFNSSDLPTLLVPSETDRAEEMYTYSGTHTHAHTQNHILCVVMWI